MIRNNTDVCKRLALRVLAFGIVFLLMSQVIGLLFGAISKATTYDSHIDANVIDLEQYLLFDNNNSKTTMQIGIYVDGELRYLTIDELKNGGYEVPKGSPVKVQLYFDTINDVKKGEKLVYHLPENLMNYSGADEEGIVWNGEVYEENAAGADVVAADWTIDNSGELVVVMRDNFFGNNNSLNLHGFYIKFSGSLSSDRGEHSGNNDDLIVFRDEVNGTGRIAFNIPFDYINERANVDVTKALDNYDVANHIATYTVTVEAPDTNIHTATNVVVTDRFTCDSSYIDTVTQNGVKCIYRDSKVSTGEFSQSTGIWNVGNMLPGEKQTLTYSVKISDSICKNPTSDPIINAAIVEFNKDGENQAFANLVLPTTVLKKEMVKNDSSAIYVDDDGNPYVEYKLTVQAKDGKEEDARVQDSFNNDSSLISKIVVTSATKNNETIEPNVTINTEGINPSLTWNIGNLDNGDTVTLTYRAYLSAESWMESATPSGTVESNDSKYEKDKTLSNSAKLYTKNNPTGDSNNPIDSVTDTEKLTKTWVKKMGERVSGTNTDKDGKIKYTIEINGDPVFEDVKTIYDTLTAGGTYYKEGKVTIDRYTSSDMLNKVDTTEFELDDKILTVDGSGQRWDINLEDYNISGRYFYVVTYYVESTAVYVSNYAGAGIGVNTYIVGTQIMGGGGMTYGRQKDYYKQWLYDNNKECYSIWNVHVMKTIPQGAIYVDRINTWQCYNSKAFWFNEETFLNFLNVSLSDGTKLEYGTDYEVELTVSNKNDTDYKNYVNNLNGNTLDRYDSFQITFKHEIECSSTNELIIQYAVNINNDAKNENVETAYYYNHCRWLLLDGGQYVPTTEETNVPGTNNGLYEWNKPLKKSDGTYNSTDGTITWKLTVNSNTTIKGSATLTEYLPEGLSFVSATLTKSCPDVSVNTSLGKIVEETYEITGGTGSSSGGDTDTSDARTGVKVTIPIENLVAYTGTDGKPTNQWSSAGQIVITLVTKVDTEVYLNMTADTTFKNKAVLTSNDIPDGVTATGQVTVPYTSLMNKYMIKTARSAYIEYALDINRYGTQLTTEDTLEVVDIMDKGMRLATSHSDFFKVYSLPNDSTPYDSSGNVDVNQIIALLGNGVEDVTSLCTIEDISGTELDGMTDSDKGKPTYLINVPDNKHVVIVYWATFEAGEDEEIDISNKASFFYNQKIISNDKGMISNSVKALTAESSLYTTPFVRIKKTDQYGNTVNNVEYGIYSVEYNVTTNEWEETLLGTELTDNHNETVYNEETKQNETVTYDGVATFGHKQSAIGGYTLYKNTLYCIREVGAPAGYTVDSTPIYFEFKSSDTAALTDAPNNSTIHQFISGGEYSVTNKFTPVSYVIPVTKTINGGTLTTKAQFSFNLKPDGNIYPVYTDVTYKNELPSDGITASITGTGNTAFDALYFTKMGKYKFIITENELSEEAKENGYSRDTTQYEVTFTVGIDTNNSLTIDSVVYSATNRGIDSSGASKPDSNGYLNTAGYIDAVSRKLTTEETPIKFDNGIEMEGTISFNVHKVVANRTTPVKEGEFGFVVSVDGEVIYEEDNNGNPIYETDSNGEVVYETDSNGNIVYETDSDGKYVTDNNGDKIRVKKKKAKVFYTKEGGDVEIKFLADDRYYGEKTYVVREVAGDDPSIEYTTDRVLVKVTVEAMTEKDSSGAEKPVVINDVAQIGVTNIEYLTDNTFTNIYKASGSLTLEGTKKLKYTSGTSGEDIDLKCEDDEFEFVVTEDGRTVAHGASKEDGSIFFTEIEYDEKDVGTHTYVISEVDKGEAGIEYSSDTVTVTVEVKDEGKGTLGISSITYKSSGGELDAAGHALFTNKVTTYFDYLERPDTGIFLKLIPFVVLVGIILIAVVAFVADRPRKGKAESIDIDEE